MSKGFDVNMKQKTRDIKNIGKVLINDIQLSDTCLGIFIPIASEAQNIREEREKFESLVTRDAKKANPEINLDFCTLHTQTDLYVNTGYRNEFGKYELEFSIGFISWITDEQGEEIYCDMSDHLNNIELSEADKYYIKKIIAQKIVEVLI